MKLNCPALSAFRPLAGTSVGRPAAIQRCWSDGVGKVIGPSTLVSTMAADEGWTTNFRVTVMNAVYAPGEPALDMDAEYCMSRNRTERQC
jgi:hypothetical protein